MLSILALRATQRRRAHYIIWRGVTIGLRLGRFDRRAGAPYYALSSLSAHALPIPLQYRLQKNGAGTFLSSLSFPHNTHVEAPSGVPGICVVRGGGHWGREPLAPHRCGAPHRRAGPEPPLPA